MWIWPSYTLNISQAVSLSEPGPLAFQDRRMITMPARSSTTMSRTVTLPRRSKTCSDWLPMSSQPLAKVHPGPAMRAPFSRR